MASSVLIVVIRIITIRNSVVRKLKFLKNTIPLLWYIRTLAIVNDEIGNEKAHQER